LRLFYYFAKQFPTFLKHKKRKEEVTMKFHARILLAQKIILTIGLFILLGLIDIPAMASDRFVDNGDGTVTDTKTGLMWATMDNGEPINWTDARSYCQSYSGGDHTDWRMPTLAELKSLYEPKIKNRRGYHIPKLIETNAESCWASETRGEGIAARFNFTYGREYWLRKTHSGVGSILPVRSGN
jgi:hypothetical protein